MLRCEMKKITNGSTKCRPGPVNGADAASYGLNAIYRCLYSETPAPVAGTERTSTTGDPASASDLLLAVSPLATPAAAVLPRLPDSPEDVRVMGGIMEGAHASRFAKPLRVPT